MKKPTAILTLNFFVLLCLIFSPGGLIAQKKITPSVGKRYGAANYALKDARQFMRRWLIAGPIAVQENAEPDSQTQEKFFNNNPITSIAVVEDKPAPALVLDGKEYPWQMHTSREDVIDLDAIFKRDYAAVYALAEIKVDAPQKAFLSVGSDDGIKVWLNGKQIHKIWIGRPVTPDEDMVAMDLQEGSNQILISVQDMAQGWGFTCRVLDAASMSEKLITASAKGDLDEINLLLASGANPEWENASGLSATASARLHGREEVTALFQQKGFSVRQFPAAERLVDGLYTSLSEKASPGIAVLVAKDGKILYKKGFGFADMDKKVPVSPETKFRIGSVTKQFTAAAILKLQEENRLQISDKLSKYFPDFPRGEEVTLHHLLTHTSGIHSYTGKGDFLAKVTSPISNDELLKYFRDDPYDFGPGEQWRYNNSGYFMLGHIIEKVSGKSYGQYLKENFFDPLKMASTGVHTSTLALNNEAKGYMNTAGLYTNALNWDMSWAGGAGALFSTLEDLYRWNEGLFSGKVLSEKSLKAAFTPVLLNNGKLPEGAKYGYGVGLGSFRGLEEVQHSGGLHGFHAQLLRVPKENLTVVILTNISPPNVNFDPSVLAEFYLWDKMQKQPSYSASAAPIKDLKIYEGRYAFGPAGVMTISAEGDALFAQLTGQSKFPIFPSAPDEFFWKVVEARMKFIRNEKGEVTHGKFTQGGSEIEVAKLQEEKIITVNPDIYKNYAGKYDYGNNFIVTVTTESGKIFAQGTNQPKLEIFPLSEKEFSVRDLNAKIIFTREADGKVSKLTLDMNGQKKDAPKVE